MSLWVGATHLRQGLLCFQWPPQFVPSRFSFVFFFFYSLWVRVMLLRLRKAIFILLKSILSSHQLPATTLLEVNLITFRAILSWFIYSQLGSPMSLPKFWPTYFYGSKKRKKIYIKKEENPKISCREQNWTNWESNCQLRIKSRTSETKDQK